jgi:hypothetical protein
MLYKCDRISSCMESWPGTAGGPLSVDLGISLFYICKVYDFYRINDLIGET